jgi:hypothetical protein
MEEIWWSNRENEEIRKEYETLVFMMETGRPIDENEHCTRGLEKKTEDQAWELYQIQRDARNAVLDEQEHQQKQKVKDFEAIAEVMYSITRKAVEAAREVAVRDAEAVKDYLFDSDTTSQRITNVQKKRISADPCNAKENVHARVSKDYSYPKHDDSSKSQATKKLRPSSPAKGNKKAADATSVPIATLSHSRRGQVNCGRKISMPLCDPMQKNKGDKIGETSTGAHKMTTNSNSDCVQQLSTSKSGGSPKKKKVEEKTRTKVKPEHKKPSTSEAKKKKKPTTSNIIGISQTSSSDINTKKSSRDKAVLENARTIDLSKKMLDKRKNETVGKENAKLFTLDLSQTRQEQPPESCSEKAGLGELNNWNAKNEVAKAKETARKMAHHRTATTKKPFLWKERTDSDTKSVQSTNSKTQDELAQLRGKKLVRSASDKFEEQLRALSRLDNFVGTTSNLHHTKSLYSVPSVVSRDGTAATEWIDSGDESSYESLKEEPAFHDNITKPSRVSGFFKRIRRTKWKKMNRTDSIMCEDLSESQVSVAESCRF